MSTKNEAMSKSARRKLAMRSKKNLKKAVKRKKIKMKRKRSNAELLQTAERKAKQLLMKKILKKDAGDATVNDKVKFSQKLEKKPGLIQKVAKKILPKLKQAETERIKKMRANKSESIMKINEGIMYNVDNKIALHKNPYRYGSTKFFEYYNDLRALKLEAVSEDLDMFLSSDIGKVGVYEGNDVLLDFPMLVEAEYQGKKVELSKPMRNNSGGGKLAVKLKDPKAKAAFKARHKCEQTKDKTTASYWSCRLPRYAKSLGLSGGGQWW